MSTRSHSRSSYSVLLLQKLLSLRDGVSPLTLVLDTPREPAVPLLEEMMLRAKTAATAAARTKIIYVSSHLAPRRRSPHVDVYVERRGEPSVQAFRDRILAEVVQPPTGRAGGVRHLTHLIVIDSLGQIAQQDPLFVAAFVSSLVSPTTSVLGLYHTDDYSFLSSSSSSLSPSSSSVLASLQGKPHPFKVLCHLATAVLRVHALHEEVARKRARDRAEELPQFGWAAGQGWPFGYSSARYSKRDLVGGAPLDRRGLLVDMELRRRSGRAVVERYVVVWGEGKRKDGKDGKDGREVPVVAPKLPWQKGAVPCTDITVMADHPLFAVPDPGEERDGSGDDDDMPTSTFNLGLTEKQRRDREGIVLPYFDAQTDIGAGEGGRILYDMGREDDFDDEEDEI